MSYLKVQNIIKKYGSHTVLNDVSLSIEKGEFVCILGPSGCGKSTLLRVIAGLENIESGCVHINGRDATLMPPAKRNFGIVFQSYALFPNLSVAENIAYGLKGKMDKSEIHDKVKDSVAMIGLQDHISKYPHQLSGGQQQRVALARAIALSPEFLLLDEPLSALDAKVRLHLRREIRQLKSKLGITTIMVTHDQEEALSMADKLVVMNNGVIEQVGTPEEIYEAPRTSFVADFIGTVNFINKTSAIRPEKINISKHENASQGKIVDIEYRGAFYRLMVESSYGIITVDLTADVIREMGVQSGNDIFFEIPHENMIMLSERSMSYA